MRHTPEGTLRRLVDDPLGVPDASANHVARCRRCSSRKERVERDAALATALLVRPHSVPDIDSAWKRLHDGPLPSETTALQAKVPSRWRWRLAAVPMSTAAVIVTVAVVVVGGTTALLTTVLAPGRPAPLTSPSAGIEALADVTGIGGGSDVLGGFDAASGSLNLPFGELRWQSSGAARPVSSIAEAEQATGLNLRTPTALPAGVGSASSILVQPQVVATISFGKAAATLAGSSLTVTAGPAVLVEYGGASLATGLPTLATFTMGRPDVSSPTSASTTSQLEAYVLSRPGLPAGLAQEIRLLGDLGAVVPLPSQDGASVTQVDVDGAPGVLVTDSSIGVSGVIWDDSIGLVHAAVGLLDETDILSVADQLG